MFRSASGSAASDDAVENATSHGSFAARQNRRTGTLNASAIGSSTNEREHDQRAVQREHQRARGC